MKQIRNFSNLKRRLSKSLLGKFFLFLFIGSFVPLNAASSAVSEKSFSAKLEVFNDDQEQRIITGKVTDQNGESMPGVSVVVQGTTIGVPTDFDGNYRIEVPQNATTLVFSFVGYLDKKVTLGNSNVVNVTMEEDSKVLDDVVVTGYQTMSKERATGSFAKVDESTLEMRPVMNVIEKIEGTTAGVQITNGSVQIRGRSTLNSSSQPLYVVDNFPIQDDAYGLSTINPEDIESVTVLKDAAAASIWGVKAANGVIVITTKKGKKSDKLNVEFYTNTSIQSKIDFANQNWMNTAQQLEMDQEFIDKGWFSFSQLVGQKRSLATLHEANIYKLGLAPDGQVWSQATYDNFVNGLAKNNLYDQWSDLLLRNDINNQYNLSISGGSDNNNFRVSTVLNNHLSSAVGNSDRNLIINIQDVYKYSDKLRFTVGANTSFTKRFSNGISPSSIRGYKLYDPLVDEYGQAIQYYRNWNRWTSQQREAIPQLGSYSYSLLDELRANDNTTTETRIRTKFGVDYTPIEGLTLSSNFQYESAEYGYDSYSTMEKPSWRISVYDMYAVQPGKTAPEFVLPKGTRYYYTRNKRFSWDWRNTINYSKVFGDHSVTLFGGFEMRKIYDNYYADTQYGYDSQTATIIPVNVADLVGGQKFNWFGSRYYGSKYYQSIIDDREVAMFSNFGYEYLDRYSINASYRVDQKNLFGSDPKYRYKGLWSVGAGWTASKEDFIKDLDIFDRLRFRVTYGLTGNASNRFSPYPEAGNYSGSWGANLYVFMRLTQPGNSKLRWEETKTLNGGFDFAVLNSRVYGTLEFYKKNSVDLIGSVPLDVTNGFASGYLNYASMENKGMEFTVGANLIQTQDFSWNVNANISYNNNTLIEIYDQLQSPSSQVRNGLIAVGADVNNVRSFNYAGLDAGGNVLVHTNEGTIDRAKNITDQSKLEMLNYNTSVAPWFGGASTTVAYKGFDLTMNLVYKFGHVFRNTSYGYSATGAYSISHNVFANRWKKPGDELTTRIPKIAYEGTNPFTGEGESHWDSSDYDFYWLYSQDNIHDAGFVRVRDIVLGYNLPKSVTSRTFIQNVRLTAQVTNPFLWVKNDLGLDPEAYSSMAFSNLKTYTLGLRLNF